LFYHGVFGARRIASDAMNAIEMTEIAASPGALNYGHRRAK
jgi:hypothetical protein